ncbi:MAG TPA: glycoside hydrolase family 6 protein [Acidimicrobiales bacterium]|nr:glycoside hydrolase family 6 protein [Acidimicrobiales bacterium]
MKSRFSKAALVAAGLGALALAGAPSTAFASVHTEPTAPTPTAGRTLGPDTKFFVPAPPDGSVAQIAGLVKSGDLTDAAKIARMVTTPQAVWFNGTTKSGAPQNPGQIVESVRLTMLEARAEHSVPVLVVYNIPGRDCSQYSSGGAATDAAYQQWMTGFARGLGQGKAVVLVEPDALANLPSDCPAGAYANETNPPTDASRIADISFDVNLLENDPNASVYLDAGHSAWHSVGDMASRLVQAGVQKAQGFFLNVSNYQYTQNEVDYGTWISDCIALGAGSTSYNYSANCPNQYWNGGPATSWNGTAMTPYQIWTSGNTNLAADTDGIDSRYASMLGSTTPTTHFVVDTSRNGTGPNDMSTYAAAPYDQPANVISTLESGNWCNPPGAGLGVAPTADTSGVSPLLDAYLWVKTPGQSDGQCDATGGVRAWDNSAYTPPISGWPAQGSATFSSFDPLWSIQTGAVTTDPAAGAWFPQQALQLAQLANPALPAGALWP